VEFALRAYRQGWFPMGDPDTGRTEWYASEPRAIVPLDERFHVPRRLARRIRSGRFVVTSDRAFDAVIRACADPTRPGAWINADIIDLFGELHACGYAHSVEAWVPHEPGDPADVPAVVDLSGRPRRLVAGLYGLAVAGLFAGEAMFSRPDLGGTDGSKVCLVRTVEHLRACGFSLFDAQFSNPHLEQFGVQEISAAGYANRLSEAVRVAPVWRDLPESPLL
jgi:leucyl/phenylalanyl-tRNA--protein transferase